MKTYFSRKFCKNTCKPQYIQYFWLITEQNVVGKIKLSVFMFFRKIKQLIVGNWPDIGVRAAILLCSKKAKKLLISILRTSIHLLSIWINDFGLGYGRTFLPHLLVDYICLEMRVNLGSCAGLKTLAVMWANVFLLRLLHQLLCSRNCLIYVKNI